MKRTWSGGIDAWDQSNYLNIWVCNLSNSSGGGMTLGYAYLPGLQGSQLYKDGLVIDYQYFGTIGGASSNSDGRTATHEIGHYLGLNHTFAEASWNGQGPCDGPQGALQCCDSDNGNVDDTPATDGIYFGSVTSSTNNNTCNDLNYANTFNTDVLDMDENFMAYSNTSWMFTIDQVNVMNATLNGYRSSLKNSTVSVNCDGSVGTGLNNYQIENLHIYPNPTFGKLYIASADEINTLSITNIIGKEILFTKDLSINTIDLSSFENGVYFINISTNKGTHIEKIILSR
ncbi:MAG: T9SS type A sorting domain-containing protein, partial [Flavobacteriales bacterium]|nr:T9SS type A sorting domain-containing protein [Flavobacteriales bacterium]